MPCLLNPARCDIKRLVCTAASSPGKIGAICEILTLFRMDESQNDFFHLRRETKGRQLAVLAFRDLLNIAEGRQMLG